MELLTKRQCAPEDRFDCKTHQKAEKEKRKREKGKNNAFLHYASIGPLKHLSETKVLKCYSCPRLWPVEVLTALLIVCKVLSAIEGKQYAVDRFLLFLSPGL